MKFVKIEDLISYQIKGLWGEEFDDSSHCTPVIKTNNMNYDGTIDLNNLTYRNIKLDSILENYLQKGDLLIEKSGGTKTHSVGYVTYFDGEEKKYVCNNFILGLRPDTTKINSKYLFYNLKYMYENGNFSDCYNKTTGIQNLKVKFYLAKKIKLREFSKQNEIVEVLDIITKQINSLKSVLENFDNIVKSQFIEMFEGKNYPILYWNDVFNTTTGKLDSNAMVENGKYPFFTCAKDILKIDKYAFDQEALLLAGNNAAGKYDVKYYKGKFNAYQRTYVLDLKEDWSYQLFKYQLEDKLEWLREQSKGINTRFITLKILGTLSFIIPPLDKQKEFEHFVQQIDKSKYVIQKQIKLLEELFEKKMNEYFGG